MLNSAGLGFATLEYAYLHSDSTSVGDPVTVLVVDQQVFVGR